MTESPQDVRNETADRGGTDEDYTEARQELEDAREKLQQARKQRRTARNALRQLREQAGIAGLDLADAERKLEEAREKVVDAAARVNEKAAASFWKRAGTEITGAWRSFLSLGLSRQTSIVYGYVVIVGAACEYIFYRQYGVNIFDYAIPQDFVLPGVTQLLLTGGVLPFVFVVLSILLFLVILAVGWIVAKLVTLRARGYTEIMAMVFPRLNALVPLSTTVFTALLLFASIQVAATGFTDSREENVSMVSTPRLENDRDLVRIGSTSTYTFFRRGTGEPKTSDPILVVPSAQIVFLTEKNRPDDDAGGNDSFEPGMRPYERDLLQHVRELKDAYERTEYVTEQRLRQRILDEVREDFAACDDSRLVLSDFIRFDRESADLGDFPDNRQRISDFVDARGGVGAPGTRWFVFGFASADGDRRRNDRYAGQRMEAVANAMCADSGADCHQNVKTMNAGEDHPINGHANARSVRIAVCG